MKFLPRYKYHLLFWILYFICWTFFSAHYNRVSPIVAFLVTFAWFISQASVFYICMYARTTRLFNKKRYGIVILCSVGILILCSVFTAACTIGILRQTTNGFNVPFKLFSLYTLLDNLMLAIVVIAIRVIKDKIKSEKRNKLLEKEKTENELRFLRSQINPHFLFNSINNIYVLIKKDPDFAATTLAKFADMLRYQLYECNADEIPIESEITYLNNYIELEKLRKGDTVIIEYNIEENITNFVIAPLLIIPFVENAFKYVSAFTDKPNLITIDLRCQNRLFTLLVTNTTNENCTEKKEGAYGGIGLENVRRRLELIYTGKHKLEINSVNNVYSVLLNIQIP